MDRSRFVIFACFALGSLGALAASAADAPAPPAPAVPAAPAPAEPPALPAPPARATGPAGTFASPEEAGRALAAAFQRNDDQGLRDVLGMGSEELVEKGEDPSVAAARKRIAEDAAKKVVPSPADDAHVTLLIGEDGWPFPVPVVKGDAGWRFDVAAGREEILARKIGRHELEVIGICRTYIDMQTAYALRDRDGDEVREYAQRLLSTPGRHDGLYWADAQDDDPSPLGVALAPLKSASTGEGAPYAGYFWRILKAQGPNAPGGAHTYVLNGNMIAGFALLAVPAEYRRTGVMTFLVSHHGKVFQKDMGERSLDLALAMDAFDPDATWADVTNAGDVASAEGTPAEAK